MSFSRRNFLTASTAGLSVLTDVGLIRGLASVTDEQATVAQRGIECGHIIPKGGSTARLSD